MLKLTLLILALFGYASSDTIADCRFEDFHGHWKIQVYNYAKNCSAIVDPEIRHESTVHFEYPNIVTNPNGQSGHWTMIDNEGAELTINQRTYLLMSWYNYTHYSCQQTIGHYTYSTIGKEWHCAKAVKIGVPMTYVKVNRTKPEDDDQMFRNDHRLIHKLNQIQNTWEATAYPQFEEYTVGQMKKMMGNTGKSHMKEFIKSLPRKEVTNEVRQKLGNLPKSWDWRTIKHPSGESYVSPIRNQKHCGSCYAFASMGAAEARVRIVTNMTEMPIFSPQDIIDCSPYSQGCDGGYAYLTLGKYGQDFGLVKEECNPYRHENSDTCRTRKDCRRHYFTNYEYLGGYDGAMTEEMMMLELVENGPFPVAIEADHDLKAYKGGIYIKPKHEYLAEFNPMEPSNHAVLLVGYGYEEELGIPFWIVKNSWGEDWGEKGFFRVRKGTDEIAIESLGFVANYVYF